MKTPPNPDQEVRDEICRTALLPVLQDAQRTLGVQVSSPSSLTVMARMLAHPEIAQQVIDRSKATPYFHLDDYMERHWVFNPYETYEEKQVRRAAGGPEPEYAGPSGRVHHILREDDDRALHDHPWNARTIILKGWYVEDRLMPDGTIQSLRRVAGDTATLKFGEYHCITEVSPGGVWTLFITEEYQGSWGFLVDGKKVPYREYLGLP